MYPAFHKFLALQQLSFRAANCSPKQTINYSRIVSNFRRKQTYAYPESAAEERHFFKHCENTQHSLNESHVK